jgi:hypothetical protein
MCLKELSFEFEGDIETGQRLQSDIRKSLTALTHTQERVLPHDPEVIEVELAAAAGNGKPPKARTQRTRRPKANSCRIQVIEMRRAGFFSQKRELSSIQAELANLGHNFKPNEISAVLPALCQKKILKRDKNEGGNFEYEQGETDVGTGDGEDAE